MISRCRVALNDAAVSSKHGALATAKFRSCPSTRDAADQPTLAMRTVHRSATHAVLVVAALSFLAASASAQEMRGELAERRAALAKEIGDGTLVVMAAAEPSISRHGYVPDQNYLYLTGL